jgi:urease accessory protein
MTRRNHRSRAAVVTGAQTALRYTRSMVALLPLSAAIDADGAAGWEAELALRFARVGRRTVLAERRHRGPLVVQKPLYPEGDEICQVLLLHPPAGIVGGDRLGIDIDVGAGAHAQVAAPGATRWYRSAGPTATATTRIRVAEGGVLEWLPQEAIAFDGTRAQLACDIELAAGATLIGWDIVALGRPAAGESFLRGAWRQRSTIRRGGELVWCERAALEGGSRPLRSGAILGGAPVFGTLWVAAPPVAAEILARCREVPVDEGIGGVTQLPGILVARYAGGSAQSARTYFASLWRLLRPAAVGRDAVPLRIWTT